MCIYHNFSDQLSCSESVCTHYPSSVSLCTLLLPWIWCSCCSVKLSVHTTPPLWVYTIPLPWVWCSCCSVSLSVCHCPSPVSLYTLRLPCESVHATPPPGLVFKLLCESVHTTPPMCLVLMLLCESTHYPSTGFGVHVALSLYTITLPWD